LLNHLENPDIKWQTIIKIGIFIGMRRCEIAGLSWTNIDLKNGLIHIEKQCKYLSEKGIYLKTPKSKKSIGMLFYSENGCLLNPDTITDWFSKFIDKNKLDKIFEGRKKKNKK